MRIAIIGSGGIGGLYGLRLAAAGADVRFVARGKHLAAMREHGLLVESDAYGAARLAKPNVVETPQAVAAQGEVDLVLIAVKLWDMAALLPLLQPLIGTDTAVLSLQNGVLKDDDLRAAFGPAHVIGGVAYVATHIKSPGIILQNGPMQKFIIGEYGGAKSPRIEALGALALKAGLQSAISEDIERTLWEKFVFLVGLSATTALLRQTMGAIRGNPVTRAFLHDIMRETVAVGRARGVALPADYADERLAFADTVPATMAASMAHDLARGNRLELDWLSGAVVTLGMRHQVPTPMNRAVVAGLELHKNGQSGPSHA
jgi:2-dehydropantoate 2-reductase